MYHRIIKPIIFTAILFSFILRVPLLFLRWFDSDEFVHLHTSWLLYHGGIPYKDYVEFHTPFIQFLFYIFHPLFGEGISLIFAARVFMLLFYIGIILLTYRLTKEIFNRRAGIFAILFLSYMVLFYDISIEIRPDMPSIFFLVYSLVRIITGMKTGKRSHFGLSGLSMGISLMFNQKIIMAYIGLIISLIWFIYNKGITDSKKDKWISCMYFVGSSGIPGILTMVFFFIHDSLKELLYYTIVCNMIWANKISPLKYIMWSLDENLIFWILGICGMILSTFYLKNKDRIKNYEFVPLFPLYLFLFGLLVISVPRQHYLVSFLPLMAVYTGNFFDLITKSYFKTLDKKPDGLKPSLSWIITSFLGIIFISFALFNDVFRSQLFDFGYKALFIFFVGISFIHLSLNNRPHLRKYLYVFMLIGLFIQPFHLIIKKLERGNADQLENIRYILENTSPEDIILDGYSLENMFRQSAIPSFMLFPGAIDTYGREKVLADIVNVLQNNPPKIVIFDAHIKLLPEFTQNLIREKYKPTGQGDIYIIKEE